MKALPARFRLEDDGQRLVISWRWFKWDALGGFAVCMMPLGFPLACYGPTLIREPLTLLDTSGLQLGCTLLHLGVVLYLFYWLVLTNLLNTTRLQASAGELLIRHGPIPAPGNHTLTRRELSQLYSQSIPGKGSTYWLMAKTRSGGTVPLLKGLDKEQVLYLERTLEQRLGIKNRAVGDEDESGVVCE